MRSLTAIELEALRRSTDQAWLTWISYWLGRQTRRGRGRRQRILELYEYSLKKCPDVFWDVRSEWPKAKENTARAHRLRILFRVITERADTRCPEVVKLMHETVDEYNFNFVRSVSNICDWQKAVGHKRIFNDELDPFKRFLLTRWDAARDGFPELFQLTDSEIAAVCEKILNRVCVTPEAIKKARQRLKLARPNDGSVEVVRIVNRKVFGRLVGRMSA